jgi:hypothetical protein
VRAREDCDPDEFALRRKGIEHKGQSLNRLDRHAAGRSAEASEPIGGECQALGLPSWAWKSQGFASSARQAA